VDLFLHGAKVWIPWPSTTTILNGVLSAAIGEVRSFAEQSCKFLAAGLTGYDACYAGLAVELGAHWITFDRRAHELIEKQDVSAYLGAGLPANW
jgi:hypothetical protein